MVSLTCCFACFGLVPSLRRCLVLFHQSVTLSWSTLPNPSFSESKWWGKGSGACIILMPGSCITPVWNKVGCVLAIFLQHMHSDAVWGTSCLAISLNLILHLSWDLYLPLVARSLFFGFIPILTSFFALNLSVYPVTAMGFFLFFPLSLVGWGIFFPSKRVFVPFGCTIQSFDSVWQTGTRFLSSRD